MGPLNPLKARKGPETLLRVSDFLISDLWLRRAANEVNLKDMKFSRITVDPLQMGGVPCVRALRIPVSTVLKLYAQGCQDRQLLDLYPDLSIEDLRDCLAFGAATVDERELPVLA